MPFSLSYALKNILKWKKRSFAIVIGFMIGVCVITAFITWKDTGSIVFAKDHLKSDFQMIVSRASFESTNMSMRDMRNLIQNDPLVDRVELVYSTFCLFNTEEKSENYVWFAEDAVDNGPVLRASVFIVDDYFLEIFRDELDLLGNVDTSNNGVLLSRSLISQIKETLGITYEVGSNIDFAIATRMVHNAGENTLKYWDRFFLKDLPVEGTYDWNPQNPYVNVTLHDSIRFWFNWVHSLKEFTRYDHLPIRLENSMFIPLSLIDETIQTKLEMNRRPPTLFIQVDPEEVTRRGISNMGKEINKLKSRISYTGSETTTYLLVDPILDFIEAYGQSRTLLIYVLPAVGLSICITIFSSEVTFKERKKEVGMLKARGATYRQLYIIFIIELLTLIFIGAALGFLPGVLLGCLIPATTGLFQYDLTVFEEFLTQVTISPYTFVFSLVVCGTIPLIYALYKANKYASTEVIRAMAPYMPIVKAKRSIIPYIFLVVIIVAIMVYTRLLFNFGVLTIRETIVVYTIILVQWVSLGVFTAFLLTEILPKFSKVFSFVLKTKGVLVKLELQRQKIFTSLMIMLILVSSIMVFSLVESETAKSNITNQIRYAIGADLRIVTTLEQPISFSQNLTSTTGLGLEEESRILRVMPVLYSEGRVSDLNIRIIGVDPMLYRDIAFWTPTSLIRPTYKQALERLQSFNGITVSEYIVNTFNLDLGSQLRVRWKGNEYDFQVVGIIRSAPGFGEAEPTPESIKKSLAFQEDERFVIVNRQFLMDKDINMTRLFFASAKKGGDVRKTREILSKLTEVKEIYSPSTFDLSEFDIYRFLYMQGVTGSLILQFLLTTIIGLVSLAFYLDYVISSRSIEYAVMRAVGATRKNVTALIFIESVVVIVVSLITGSFLGISYSTILFDLLLQIFPFSSLVPYVLVIPVITLFFGFGVVLLGMLLGSYFPAKKAGRTDVATVLRNL